MSNSNFTSIEAKFIRIKLGQINKESNTFKHGFFQLPEPDVEAQEFESLLKDSEAGDTLLEANCS
jgi:hypothetical protein